ncbi:magnesium transporter CorA family protein [Mesorhizobium sp. WSM2239]|jgi:magnesium transporter|uniref:Magnesium transport protein CorA n=2 Tax=unclassified Mesorhizobium TaxID=325217 RepID=A0AAU8DD75_9HYPH
MIKAFVVDKDRLRVAGDLLAHKGEVVWADLLNPTKEEEKTIEDWIGIGIPTREEMEEIEISSRLYTEKGAFFMTATLPAHADGDRPVMSPVTFVLSENRLITIRYHEPRAFQTFPMRAEKADTGCTSGETILIALLEAIVDRLADVLERASREVVEISHDIFHPAEKKASKRDRSFQIVLRRIGRKEDLVSKIQDSLLTLQRLSGFLGQATVQRGSDKDLRGRVKTLSRDVESLSDHATFLSQKITFLLDATLGMINIEQNAIIKIVSVAAVVFLPPTLVASVYGMNFDVMPELKWLLGYPFALALMVVSAVLPFWYFKRRGWL